jgi:rhodanese-related sulfurtransferase
MNAIPPRELLRLLDEQPDLTVLDVRTPAEFNEVHVTGAQNIPLADLRPKALFAAGRLSAGRPIYLVCRSGARASQAAQKFEDQGYDATFVVQGGTLACVQAGLPVVRGGNKAGSAEGYGRRVTRLLVLLGLVLGYFVYAECI